LENRTYILFLNFQSPFFQVNLPSESSPSKDKVDNLSLASSTNNSSNQSELSPLDSIRLKKNETHGPAPLVQTDKTPNPKQENLTALAPLISQDTKKTTNSSKKGGGAVTAMTGNKTDTGIEKDDNVGNVKGLCDVASEKCSDDDNWIACLQHPANGNDLLLHHSFLFYLP
jgi:hypothetical protein